jgi:hypothetical protein
MKYLLILCLFAIGCANAEQSTHTPPSVHPVYDYAGPHAKATICSNASVTDPVACQDYYEWNFKQQLLFYYGGTDSLFSACDSNPNLCRDELSTEEWMRSVRAFASDQWGWPCERLGYGSGPEC